MFSKEQALYEVMFFSENYSKLNNFSALWNIMHIDMQVKQRMRGCFEKQWF